MKPSQNIVIMGYRNVLLKNKYVSLMTEGMETNTQSS
jgi:hypothetical protein